MKLDLADFHFLQLNNAIDLTAFDSDDEKINAFLSQHAINYANERIASSYLFMDNNAIVAYFSISNNCLRDLGEIKGYNRKTWKKLHKQSKIPHAKQIKQYPAILIGRIGVDKKYQRTGIAYQLIDFIKGWVLIDHKPACRFLILDAYNQDRQIKFYIKNDFSFLLDDDNTAETRTMYFDMARLE